MVSCRCRQHAGGPYALAALCKHAEPCLACKLLVIGITGQVCAGAVSSSIPVQGERTEKTGDCLVKSRASRPDRGFCGRFPKLPCRFFSRIPAILAVTAAALICVSGCCSVKPAAGAPPRTDGSILNRSDIPVFSRPWPQCRNEETAATHARAVPDGASHRSHATEPPDRKPKPVPRRSALYGVWRFVRGVFPVLLDYVVAHRSDLWVMTMGGLVDWLTSAGK